MLGDTVGTICSNLKGIRGWWADLLSTGKFGWYLLERIIGAKKGDVYRTLVGLTIGDKVLAPMGSSVDRDDSIRGG